MSSACTLNVAVDPIAADVLTGWLVMWTTGFWFVAEDGVGALGAPGALGVSPPVDEPLALQPANRA
jgi:hypothetical protein